MKKFKRNTYLKVLLSFILLMIIVDIIVWNNIKNFVIEGVKSDSHEKISLAKKLLPDSLIKNEDLVKLKRFADEVKRLTDNRLTVINKEGKVIADSEIPIDGLNDVENHLQRPEVQESLISFSGLAIRRSFTIDRDLIYYSEKISDNGRVIGFIRLAHFSTDFDNKISFGRQLIIILNLVLFGFIFIVIFIFTRSVDKQLTNLKNTIDEIGEGKKIPPSSRTYSEFDEAYGKVKVIIEKLHQENETLATENSKLNEYLNSLDSGIVAFDNDGFHLFSNTKFLQILDLQKINQAEINYSNWLRFPPLTKDIADFLTLKKPIEKTTKYYGHKYINYIIMPLRTDDKSTKGFIINVKDVTHLQKLETIRKDFIANVSHEFKTPLTTIRGYSETLLSENNISGEVIKKFLGKIFNQTIHLENIVTDLLNLSRIEQGEVLKIKRINPFKNITKYVNDFAEDSENFAKRLKTDIIYPESKVYIDADKSMLKSIVNNLLSNAFQYGGKEEDILFKLWALESSIRFEIIDKGIGISKNDIDRIFERFYRTEAAREWYTGGSGLGLSLVKNAVQQLNGRFGVESELGKGSLFWVELPIAQQD